MRRNAPLLGPQHKYCFRCATAKPAAEFYAVKSKPDGRASRCKECSKQASKDSRETRMRLEALYQFCKERGLAR